MISQPVEVDRDHSGLRVNLQRSTEDAGAGLDHKMDEAGPLEKGNDGHDDAIGGEEDDADVEPGVAEDDDVEPGREEDDGDVEPGGEEGPAKESGEERHRRRGTSDRDCCRHWRRRKIEFSFIHGEKFFLRKRTRVPAVVPDIEVVGTLGEPLDGLLVGPPVDRIDRRGALDLQIA